MLVYRRIFTAYSPGMLKCKLAEASILENDVGCVMRILLLKKSRIGRSGNHSAVIFLHTHHSSGCVQLLPDRGEIDQGTEIVEERGLRWGFAMTEMEFKRLLLPFGSFKMVRFDAWPKLTIMIERVYSPKTHVKE